MGRNKIVTCGKCLRIMRTDNIRRHMLQHEKEKYEKESYCSSSIATSRTSLQEEEETESNFSSISTNTSKYYLNLTFFFIHGINYLFRPNSTFVSIK